MLSAAYPEHARARVMGIFNAAIPLGAALGTVLGGGSKLASTILVLALVGAPLGGFLANRWKRSKQDALLVFCAITSILAAALMYAGFALHGQGAGYVMFCLWGVLTVCYLPPATAVTQDVVHPGMRAMAWGMCVFCMYLLGGAYSPWIVGAMTDAFGGGAAGLEKAMLMVPATGIFAAVFFFLGSRFYVRDVERVKKVVLQAE